MLCLFDLDGTLIDSELGILACVKHALAQLQIAAPSQEALRGWIGPPLWHSFGPLVDHDPLRIEAAIGHYHERFHSDGWREYTIYPGIEAMLGRLHAAGHQLAVVTGKPHQHAAPIIEALPFGKAFARMYNPAAGSQHSEKASMVAAALADFGTTQAAMIGDRHFDIEGALANGIAGIGVLWGFGSRSELEQAGASALAATPEELAILLETSGLS